METTNFKNVTKNENEFELIKFLRKIHSAIFICLGQKARKCPNSSHYLLKDGQLQKLDQAVKKSLHCHSLKEGFSVINIQVPCYIPVMASISVSLVFTISICRAFGLGE